jgi:hypothetical protein
MATLFDTHLQRAQLVTKLVMEASVLCEVPRLKSLQCKRPLLVHDADGNLVICVWIGVCEPAFGKPHKYAY